MRNEKKHSRNTRANADNNSRDNEKQTRVPRTPVAFRREGQKRVKEDMQTTNNINTLTKKGENIMDFDNGIFRTVPHDTVPGVVWLVRVADGELITTCRTQSDVEFCVAELMRQRLSL